MTKKFNLKNKFTAYLTILSIFLLGTTCFSSTTYAQENEIGTVVTTVIVTDINTGEELNRYTIDTADYQIEENTDGTKTVNTTVDVGQTSGIQLFTNSNTSDTFQGWKGTVNITYTIDDTYACLEKAGATWKRVSGSVTRGKSSLTYGQDLTTNADFDNYDMTNVTSVQLNTGFTPGKYGYNLGHKVGANSYAVLGSTGYTIVCNVNL